MIYGVEPHMVDLPTEELESSLELVRKIKTLGIAEAGEKILLVHGTFWKRPGLTNTLSVITMPDIIDEE